MTTLNELLRRNGVDPNEVSLLRHKIEASQLRDRSIADFERYQLTQEADRRVFRQPRYWASFVAPTGAQTKFVGLYEVASNPDVTVDWPDPLTGRAVGADKPHKAYEAFETILSPIMSEYIGQLFIEWNGSERSWAQHAGSNDKRVTSQIESRGAPARLPLIPDDLSDVLAATTRKAFTSARIGQAWFRSQLLQIWNGRCAITGLALPGLLRASHIKPWRSSTSVERLDPANGLLLAVQVDALFDTHLISIAADGSLIWSDAVTVADLAALGIPADARVCGLHSRTHSYLKHHRARMRHR